MLMACRWGYLRQGHGGRTRALVTNPARAICARLALFHRGTERADQKRTRCLSRIRCYEQEVSIPFKEAVDIDGRADSTLLFNVPLEHPRDHSDARSAARARLFPVVGGSRFFSRAKKKKKKRVLQTPSCRRFMSFRQPSSAGAAGAVVTLQPTSPARRFFIATCNGATCIASRLSLEVLPRTPDRRDLLLVLSLNAAITVQTTLWSLCAIGG